MDLPGNEDEDRRNVGEDSTADPKPDGGPEAVAAEDLAVEGADGHELEERVCLLALGQPPEILGQHALLEVSKVICPLLRSVVQTARSRPREVRRAAALAVLPRRSISLHPRRRTAPRLVRWGSLSPPIHLVFHLNDHNNYQNSKKKIKKRTKLFHMICDSKQRVMLLFNISIQTILSESESHKM